MMNDERAKAAQSHTSRLRLSGKPFSQQQVLGTLQRSSKSLTLSMLQSSSFSLQRSGEAWSTKRNLNGVWRLSKRSPGRTRKTETARKAERNGEHPASDCSTSWAGRVGTTQKGAEAGKGGRPDISGAGPQQVSRKAWAKAGPCSLHRWQKVSAFLSVFYRFLSITGKDFGCYK